MKCPKHLNSCKSQAIARTKKGNFICSGINNKPCIKGDIIKLCLKGRFCQSELEMTPKEGLGIITVLSASVYNGTI